MIEWINNIFYFFSVDINHIFKRVIFKDQLWQFWINIAQQSIFCAFHNTNVFGMTNKNDLVQKCNKSQNRKHISESYRGLFWNKMFLNIFHWLCISQAQADPYKFYNTVEHFPCLFVHLSWSASRRQQDYLACVCLRYGGRASNLGAERQTGAGFGLTLKEMSANWESGSWAGRRNTERHC